MFVCKECGSNEVRERKYRGETKLESGDWCPTLWWGFETQEEAWVAIGKLKEIDEDYAVAEYRVVEVKP